MSANVPSRPVNSLIALGLSLMPFPALMLVERATQPCGDGLCGFWPGLMVIGALLAATLICLFRALRRNEQPAWLLFLPLLAWLVLAKPLFV